MTAPSAGMKLKSIFPCAVWLEPISMQALSFLETAFIDWVHPFTLQAKTIKKLQLQFRVKNFPGYKLSVEHRFVLEFSQVIFFIYFYIKPVLQQQIRLNA